MNYSNSKIELNTKGYSTIPNLYSPGEIDAIINCIENAELKQNLYSKTQDLFAIRQLIKTIPNLKTLLFNKKFNDLTNSLFESNHFLTKAIYFDKPNQSNWFVAFHQDLSISVDKKFDLNDYKNWTFKRGQYGVQPPIDVLENTITIRIHLDKTTKDNGALRLIPKSHLKGIVRNDSKEWSIENESICAIERGSAMLMKPLLLHASNRTTNNKRRRVIHLEFNSHQLPKPLEWLEYESLN